MGLMLDWTNATLSGLDDSFQVAVRYLLLTMAFNLSEYEYMEIKHLISRFLKVYRSYKRHIFAEVPGMKGWGCIEEKN